MASGLTHNETYLIKAYLSNGKDDICSDLRSFTTLEAELAEIPNADIDCGFMYGENAASATTCIAELINNTIIAKISDLPNDTEFMFRAYISTGDEMSTSSWTIFKTSSTPSSEPSEGEDGESIHRDIYNKIPHCNTDLRCWSAVLKTSYTMTNPIGLLYSAH